MSSKCHVLIPDGHSTWALTVINCLAQNSNYKLFILSQKKRTPTKYSKYTAYYQYYNQASDEEWLDIITEEVQTNNISVIIPIAESEIRFLIKHQKYLPKSVKAIPLPEISSFETAINKLKLSKFLESRNLPHPKFKSNSNSEAISDYDLNFDFPVLIKPLHDKGGDGIQKINSKKELDQFFDTNSNENDVLIQEYISGYDIDCSVICSNGNILAHTIQKGNLKGHNAFAPQLGFDFLNNDGIYNVVSQLMKSLNWSGVAHVDLRYDELEKDYKIIEINARFWGSVEGSKFAGVNFPDLAIQLAANGQIEKHHYKEIKFMRLKGVLKTIKRNPFFILKRKFLLNHTETKSFLRDPLPTCFRFVEWLGRRF